MTNLQDHPDFTLVGAIIGGSISAVEAGCGLPPATQAIFGLAEKLGELSRGDTVRFEPEEAGQLHEIIESAVGLILAGKIPTTAFDKVARRFMDLAFEIDDPMSWAVQLSVIRDSSDAWTANPAGTHSQA